MKNTLSALLPLLLLTLFCIDSGHAQQGGVDIGWNQLQDNMIGLWKREVRVRGKISDSEGRPINDVSVLITSWSPGHGEGQHRQDTIKVWTSCGSNHQPPFLEGGYRRTSFRNHSTSSFIMTVFTPKARSCC